MKTFQNGHVLRRLEARDEWGAGDFFSMSCGSPAARPAHIRLYRNLQQLPGVRILRDVSCTRQMER